MRSAKCGMTCIMQREMFGFLPFCDYIISLTSVTYNNSKVTLSLQ